MADHLQNTPIVEALMPRFKVPLHHRGLSLEAVLAREKVYQAPSLVAEAIAVIANDQLKSVFALSEENQLMKRLSELAGWTSQPEEFMVNHAGETFFVAPHFSPELKTIFPTDGQPPLVTLLDHDSLVMAVPTEQDAWQCLSVRPDQSNIKELIATALRVIWEPADPVSEKILAACETATRDFRARH